MAWRWIPQAIETGVVTDPRDLVRNQAEFAGEFNGHIDRDNVLAAQVTSGKPQIQALVAAGHNPQAGAPLQTIAAGQTGEWTDIATMQTSVTTDDGEIIVDADVSSQWTGTGGSAGNEKREFRLLANGIPIAHTGWVHEARLIYGASMTGSAPTFKGTTLLQVQIRVWVDPAAGLTNLVHGLAWGVAYTANPMFTLSPVDILAGNVCWVHRKR